MEPNAPATAERPGSSKLPIGSIHRNPEQPRQTFDPASLEELSNSIKAHGVLQPIAVMQAGAHYILVAGERRWRAAQQAGLTEIPAVVLDSLSDQEILECALIENLQRENLSPLEEARAYQALVETFGLSQDEVAERVSKSRPAVANTLRLLKLSEEFQRDMVEGRLTAGHARALLSLDNERMRQKLRDIIVNEQLSVRQAEERATRIAMDNIATGRTAPRQQKSSRNEDADVRRLREQLIEAFACKVDVKSSGKDRGKIEIYYDSLDELERILNRLRVEA
ncbi:MAG: ParB/RepB/Spo0J family partition protein [Candidatus Sumerlaeaceae bacterium]